MTPPEECDQPRAGASVCKVPSKQIEEYVPLVGSTDLFGEIQYVPPLQAGMPG